MKKLYSFLILMLILTIALTGCALNDKKVSTVKNGHFTNFPETTIGTAFDHFFGDPQWKHFKSNKNEDVVEFTGKCMYQDVKVSAKMQFLFSDDKSFELKFLSFNDVPQNMLIMAGLISKVFETANTPAKENTTNKNNAVKPKPITADDLVVLGIPPTAKKIDIINKMGTPQTDGALKRSMNASYYMTYNGVQFNLTSSTNDGQIATISITNNAIKTVRGISVGDPESKVIEIYGDSYKLVKNNGGNEYKYMWGKANTDDAHGMSFQCDNGKISSITIFP